MLLNEKGFFDCNSQTLKMFGFKTKEEFTAIHPSDVSPDSQPDGRDSLSASQEHIQTAYRQGYDRFEWVHRRSDGEDFPAEVLLSAFDFGGQRVLQATVRDITERKQAAEALAASEAQFRSLFEQSADAILLIENGIFTECNQATVHMMHATSKEQFLSLHPSMLSPEYQPDGRLSTEKADEMMQVALEKGSNRFEWIHRRVDGAEFPVEVLLTAISTGNRQVIHTVWRDITERRQIEQTLQDTEVIYSAVVTQAKDGVVIIQDNVLQFANQSLSDMLGYTLSELENTRFIDYVASENKPMVVNRIKAHLDGEDVPTRYEISLERKDGMPVLVELSAGVKGYRGRPAYVAMIRDISERKQAEENLLESEEKFRRFTEKTMEGLIFLEQDRIVDANPAAFNMFGLSESEFMGKDLLEFIAPESRETVLKHLPTEPEMPYDAKYIPAHAKYIPTYDDASSITTEPESSDESYYEIECIRKDGSIFPAEASTNSYSVGDRTLRVTSIRNITERKKLESQIRGALEHRGLQVQLSTQISQSIAAASSLAELYERVVTQIKEQFGYYHTQLLRYDPAQEAVVLVTGYGEVGAKMLAAGHRMPMGKGLIGTAAATGETVLRPSLENDPDWRPNPLLPETKGEIAVPIKLGDTILGVLDIQSSVAGALGADDQLLLEGLCGQVATAIENTRLRQEMAERLEEVNRLYRAMSREGWQTYREKADLPSGFIYDQAGLRQIQDTGLAQELFANIPLTVPGGEVIGKLAVADDPQRPITPDDETFLQQVSEQLALALESARLFEQTQTALSEVQRRASELETVARVSATTSSVLDPDQLLQTVVDLTKERFGLYHAHIYVYEESWNTLLLAAGAGEVGRKLVAEEHAIPLSIEQSLVARAAHERKAIIVNDVNSEPGFLPNPLLPETRAEMAIPMMVGDKLLGVFDVQSDKEAGFSDEDASVYVTLASQVGVALQNARLYMEQAALVTQLRELDRLKSSFLANMSHELRTPLNSILGFADVIIEELDGPLTENMSNDLRLIQKNGQHLLHLINDVLDMAKIEAGRMNLNPENFKAFEVLEEVTSITSTLASEKNLALFIQEDSDRDVSIYADRTRLRQVMINLVNNAIKFTETGNISLKLTTIPGARVLITVKDTGIGIPPDKLEAIFQEFTQVDSSSTRKAGGTGLGLPISRKLVEMHGGRLWAESNGVSGEGSTFFVELPIEARITETIEKQAK
jgi:PAS domain S-box-containing protein